nr:hypothetical protein [Deltaproteobacteria bacterium]
MRRGGWRCFSTLLLALGCSGDEVDPFAGPVPSQCPSTPMERSLVVTRMRFVKATMPGVVDGFDLDGRVSRNDDAASCRRVDFTSPDGTAGVDNQLSLLVPVLETQTAGALDEAVQAAINSGQLLLSMSIEGLDDRRDDPCVQLVFRQLRGMPFVGSDHRLDPGQTFETARDQPVSRVTGRMRDGVIEPAPSPWRFPWRCSTRASCSTSTTPASGSAGARTTPSTAWWAAASPPTSSSPSCRPWASPRSFARWSRAW